MEEEVEEEVVPSITLNQLVKYVASIIIPQQFVITAMMKLPLEAMIITKTIKTLLI